MQCESGFSISAESQSTPHEFSQLPDSSNYILKLENRLTKVKGLDKNLTSKGMISVLQRARDDYMSRLMSSSEGISPVIEGDGNREISVSYIEKKLFPEKNGVTYEELQRLIDSDTLAKITDENNAESDSSIDR